MDQLTEQKEYYRQRAPEYDQWWQRRGQYELDDDQRADWEAGVAEAERALSAFAPAGDVLEYAAGTGWWTDRLARHARHVTAVDAHTETLDLNRRRTAAAGNISYVQADIFAWTPPPAAFDVVFFSYWLSHVPDDRLGWFWQQVSAAARPDGRVFLLDSYGPRRLEGDAQPRVLNDGRRFQVVKRYWQPAELTAYAATVGWRLDARVTANGKVIYASGERLVTQ